MKRNHRTRRIAASAPLTVTAAAPVAAPVVADLLQQLLLALQPATPATPAAPAADAPPAESATAAAIGRVQRRKAATTSRSAARAITVQSDESLCRFWVVGNQSPVVRPFARLAAVRYDTKVNRFRSPTTQEFRRSKGFPSWLRPASSVLPAPAVFDRLRSLGILAGKGSGPVLLRNSTAGVELSLADDHGKLVIAARTFDNSALDTAPRGTRLAITNFLNAMIFTA